MRARVMAAVGFSLCLGCSDDRPSVLGDEVPTDNPTHRLAVDGVAGMPIEATGLFDILSLPVRVNGVQGVAPLLVDTGSPYTFVIPSAFPGATLPSGSGEVATFEVGGLTMHDAPVLAFDPLGLTGLAGGIVGVNLICRYAVTFDYQRRAVTLGDAAPAADTEAPVTHMFSLRGGGYGTLPGAPQARYYGPTRLLVPVEIDGVALTLLFDTGASMTALRPEVFARFAADGRRSLSIGSVMQTGSGQQPVVRARSVRFAGAEVTGAPMSVLAEQSAQAASEEVNTRVDGLLGLTFARRFMVTIDYPHGALSLRRYRDQSFYRDQFVRAGVLLGTQGDGQWRVAQVFEGSQSASLGLTVGEVVRSIDGRALAGLSAGDVDVLLRGAAGESRTLVFDARTVVAPVEDLLR